MELNEALNIVNLYAQAETMIKSYNLIMRFIHKCFNEQILKIVKKDTVRQLFPLSKLAKILEISENTIDDNLTTEQIHENFDTYFKISHGRKYIPKTLEIIIGLIVGERCRITLEEHVSEIVNNYPTDRENVRKYIKDMTKLCNDIRSDICKTRLNQCKLRERNFLPTHKCIGNTLCALSTNGEICMICSNIYNSLY